MEGWTLRNYGRVSNSGSEERNSYLRQQYEWQFQAGSNFKTLPQQRNFSINATIHVYYLTGKAMPDNTCKHSLTYILLISYNCLYIHCFQDFGHIDFSLFNICV